MANIFTQNPIYIDTDTTVVGNTNWRGTSGGQLLNSGNLPTTLQQTSGAVTRQWGIRPIKLVFQQASGSVASVVGNIVISDPQVSGSTSQLFLFPVIAVTQLPVEIQMDDDAALWRDFIVTGATATKVSVQIFYRA